MYRQLVKGRQMGGWLGILFVLGLVAGVFVLSLLAQVVALYTGFQYGSFVVWGLGAVAVIFILQTVVSDFQYTLADGMLKISRLYGVRARDMAAVAMSDVLDFGTPEEMTKKHPEVRAKKKACSRGEELPVMALVCRRERVPTVILFQPDRTLCQKLAEQRGIHL